jgi:hypothetical protein
MKEFPCIKNIKRDIENCLVEIEFCENVMESPCSIYFLDKRNQGVIEEITNGHKAPMTLTRVKLEIIPSDMTQYLFSLNGLETIIYNLFRSENQPFIKDLKKGDVILKTYFKKDEYYTLPLICLEVIFTRKLKSKSIDNLWKTLKTNILSFTGSVGDVDVIEVQSISQFKDYLHVPLLVGQPEFQNEGVFKKKHFNNQQLIELNHIHGITLYLLDMNEIINNKYLSIYDDIRECILSSQNGIDYSHQTEADDYIKVIFAGEDIDNLPF